MLSYPLRITILHTLYTLYTIYTTNSPSGLTSYRTYVMQACFLVWCYYPKTQGAQLIYTSAIKPYLVPALGLKDASKKE
jgi:hypothetical protein